MKLIINALYVKKFLPVQDQYESLIILYDTIKYALIKTSIGATFAYSGDILKWEIRWQFFHAYIWNVKSPMVLDLIILAEMNLGPYLVVQKRIFL